MRNVETVKCERRNSEKGERCASNCLRASATLPPACFVADPKSPKCTSGVLYPRHYRSLERVLQGATGDETINIDNYNSIFRVFDPSVPQVRLTLDTNGTATFAGDVNIDSSSTSGSTVLDVQGTAGQLFSVTNSLSGDLFSVSDGSSVDKFVVNSVGDNSSCSDCAGVPNGDSYFDFSGYCDNYIN